MALRATLLPAPVAPAMSRWGIFGEVKRDVFAACAFAEGYGQARRPGADFFVLQAFP